MCNNCNLNWLDRELTAIKQKLKDCPPGHLEFYLNYIKVMEDKKRRELMKVVKGGKSGDNRA